MGIMCISRSVLGPDLIFVVLTMDMEEVKKRVMIRHHGDESAVEMFEVQFLKSVSKLPNT